MSPPHPDALAFVRALCGDEDAPATTPLDFAWFQDAKEYSGLAGRKRGTLVELWPTLERANSQGAGVFLTVNVSNGNSFYDKDIVAPRACFIDDDKGRTLEFPLLPSLTVQSAHGQHAYWFLVGSTPIEAFTPLQRALAARMDTDPRVCNPGRVMRLPGTYHHKGEPFLVRLVQSTDVEYTTDEIREAFALRVTSELPKEPSKVTSKLPTPADVDRARAYLHGMGPAIQGEGGSNHTIKAAYVCVRDYALPDDVALEVLNDWNLHCVPSWTQEELQGFISRAHKGKGELGSKLPSASVPGKYREAMPAWNNSPTSPDRGPLVNWAGKEGEEHQIQPGDQMLANHSHEIVRYCDVVVFSVPGIGLKHYSLNDKNIASSATAETTVPAVRNVVTAMMGGLEPTPKTFEAATKHLRSLPRPQAALPSLRWEGETHMALHELPLPKEGDWSSHKEFIDRCSCPDTVMAWVWTCLLPEEQTGREALLLFGHGQDGKSYWCESLLRFLGPAATTSEILKGENRFELANIVDKRLVYFGDFRNPRPLHPTRMREIISGAERSVEQKGKDIVSIRLHPRCLMTTNVEPRISTTDRAERTRVRRINIAQLANNRGDLAWPGRLLAQMPAFLYECKKVYARFAVPGQDLPETQACADALLPGEEERDLEFDYLAERVEFTAEGILDARRLTELLSYAGLKSWDKKNAYDWMRDRGARIKAVWDNKTKKTKKVWAGIQEIKETGKLYGG